MILTEDQLKEVEEFAGLFFSLREILVIMALSLQFENDFDLLEAFSRGRLKSEAEIRKSIFEHARNGSSPAQQMAVKIMEDVKLEERF